MLQRRAGTDVSVVVCDGVVEFLHSPDRAWMQKQKQAVGQAQRKAAAEQGRRFRSVPRQQRPKGQPPLQGKHARRQAQELAEGRGSSAAEACMHRPAFALVEPHYSVPPSPCPPVPLLLGPVRVMPGAHQLFSGSVLDAGWDGKGAVQKCAVTTTLLVLQLPSASESS